MRVVALALLAFLVPPGHATEPAGPPAEGPYETRAASSDGIGKVYMGREISFVLGHRGIPWLERAERAAEEQPDTLVELLDLAPDTVIADLGAGSGYFTFRLQRVVPQGRVLAVDIQPEMLAAIESKRTELGVSNVETVLGSLTDPALPEAGIDAVLMVDAYHEFSHPREMMEGVVTALRPGGHVYLVEYRAEDPDVPMLPLHKMTVEQSRKELAAVGLEFVENREGLPWQHLMVFRKPAPTVSGLVDEIVTAYGGPAAVVKLRRHRVRAETKALLRDGAIGQVTRDIEGPDSLRVRIEYPGRTELRILHGQSGWRGDDAGVEPVSGPLLGSMAYQMFRSDPAGALDRHRNDLIDVGGADDGAHRELMLRPSEGLEVTYSIELETRRITHVRGRIRHGTATIEFATRFGDFRLVDGVRFPFLEVNYASGRKVAETRILEVDWTPADLGPFRPD